MTVRPPGENEEVNEHLPHWLQKIGNSVAGLVANDCDLDEVSGEEAAELVELFSAIERSAALGKLKAARRVEETKAYQRDGAQDAAGWFARKTGTSKREAQRSLDAAKALDDLDATREAAERGELSEQQLREVTDAAGVNPGAEQELLDTARSEPMPTLKERALKARATAGDRRTRHQRIRARRHLRHGTDAEGAFWMSYRNTADVGAAMLAALKPIEDELFAEARRAGEREPHEAYAADALAAAVCGENPVADTDDGHEADAANGGTERGRRRPAKAHRARPSRDIKVIVRIDHPALVRGHTEPGELCDVAGLGPIPVSTVQEMLNDAFLAAIVTDGVDVRSVAHLGRRTTAHQQTALEFTRPRCEVTGCGRTMFLETDHRTGWSKTHDTVFDDLDRLCEHHHDLKTNEGWALEAGTGPRRLLPPSHPEHPAHAPPEEASGHPPKPAA